MPNRARLVLLLVFGALFLAGCPCSTPIPMELTPVASEEVDIAYAVTGPHGFEGLLYNPFTDDLRWVLEGTFVFPHPGYTVIPNIAVAESFPEHVHIQFDVVAPAAGAYPQVIDEQPVALTILVSDAATFTIDVQDRCWLVTQE